ncbi:dephospho-CoA kinase [Fonsecaea monophora]|uniref:Dephospho-CoA kinase n=3 Tax=Fonsecaea TaxID=40354 RepID=A0A0D2HBQ8_9EURO|nr:dephospho-CoA kinase [Fonsecaea pedrosoi CBS 271.37]XP_022505404.1 dephospho-CoA kinase [Fonsecaea nubica]XP_022506596.1 dephospho-CoA kinase [Fonsecaea monophora]KAH0834454.1 Dephospho-CoA kinase CAB5 [Fonsecaea pedrosoi]KIW81959.1 dephospho-CoA kinase [Fonsecaea pedrosoi CBS 271.37]OAG34644.1 dephospho-CoA kinase [Fonsecaea monophora]OAL40392.1 dephospho-CoA kinase [Fonsecaea nubica]
MLVIGLTGSIATGKSTCAQILSSPPHSLPLVDADLLARKAVEPGTWGYRRIVATFGPTTPDLLLPASDPQCGGNEDGPNGKGRPLNRPALGRRVFGNTEERIRDRKKLNAIVHPAVRFLMARAMLYYYFRGYWAVLVDVPLLFESGLDIFCSTVIVVAVSDPAIQMQRLRERDPHLSPEDAENRVKSQVDVREKAARCERRNNGKPNAGKGYVLYNDGDKDDLKLQIADVMAKIKSQSPRWWSLLLLVCPPLMATVASWEVLWSWYARRKTIKERGEEMAKPK